MRKLSYLLSTIVFLSACQQSQNPKLTSFEVFCEMVANDAKPIALSHPMEASDLDKIWKDFQGIADSYEVSLFREKDFPVTSLFPASVTDGKEVVLIYRAPRLVQYEQFKNDRAELEEEAAARRFGRLLGYTPQGTNELLMKNTDFRTLETFGLTHQTTHLYYADPAAAIKFYRETLGLPVAEDSTFQIGKDVSIQIHGFNRDHPAGQSQSTAIALLTDQLPAWYAYALEQEIPIKYTYKPRDGGPHDGFVAIDPGGYLLEFEQFKQHSENELFMAHLENAPKVQTNIEDLNFYGSITWTYHNDLLKMQQFYEEVLGFRMVADQGWTKIFQTSSAGFIGLVDERRGMMDYANEKAVEVEWALSNKDEAIEYFSASEYWEDGVLVGPELYRYRLR